MGGTCLFKEGGVRVGWVEPAFFKKAGLGLGGWNLLPLRRQG